MAIRMEDAAVYLSHHGIKGQKWGVRNGPPYPLDAATSARVKAGAKSGGEHVQGGMELALTGGLLMAPVVATVFKSVHEHMKAKREHNKMAKKMQELSNAEPYKDERENEELDPETGLYLKNREMSIDEDVDRVNPSYGKDDYFSTNCAMCTITMDMRQRGYDVHASTLFDKNSATDTYPVMDSWYEGGTRKRIKHDVERNYDVDDFDPHGPKLKEYASSVMKEMKSYGNGAHGELVVCWNTDWASSHSVFFTVEKNKPVIYDTQTHEKYSTSHDIEEFLAMTSYSDIKRLDNLKPNVKNMKACGIFE